jgi:hypothetical protein
MSVDPTGRQAEHPNLRPNPAWVKGGPSPNPTGGESPYHRKLRLAIEKQEPVENVCAVVAAMREDAMAHEKHSAAAAKVYFAAVGLPMNREPPKVDLSKAPDDVVNWLADNVQ